MEEDGLARNQGTTKTVSLSFRNATTHNVHKKKIKHIFSQFGVITSCVINRKMVYITFEDTASANKAVVADIAYDNYPIAVFLYYGRPVDEKFLASSIDHSDVLEKILSAQNVEEQVDILIGEIAISPVEAKRREDLRLFMNSILHDLEYEFYLFGSSVNGLGFKNSDVDFFLRLCNTEATENVKRRLDYNSAMALLTHLRLELKNRLKMRIFDPIPSFRCPILKIDFKKKGSIFQEEGIECDINITSYLGVINSKLLKTFCEINPKFRKLCIVIRYWAKLNNFIGSNQFSSYAMCMLIIFYCQKKKILPTVEFLRNMVSQPEMVDKWDVAFFNDVMKIPRFENETSIPDLIYGFFDFYYNFSFATEVICPRIGKTVMKPKIHEINKDFEISNFVCIMDPFDLSHNITKHVQVNVFHSFIECISRIRQMPNLFKENGTSYNYWGLGKLFYHENRDLILDKNTRKLLFPSVGKTYYTLNTDIVMKRTGESLRAILENWANEFVKLSMQFLGLCFKTQLIGKYDIVMNDLSPFAEIQCVIKDSGYDVWLKRPDYIKKFKVKYESMATIKREEMITQEILKESTCRRPACKIDFVFAMYAQASLPRIVIEIIKSEYESPPGDFKSFLRENLYRIVDESYRNIIVID